MPEYDFDWNDIDDCPPDSRGHYLVAQRKGRDRCYRFVRFWEGDSWTNPREDEYGPVTHWMRMKPVPY